MRNPEKIIFKIDDVSKLADIKQAHEIRLIGINEFEIFNEHLKICKPRHKRLFFKGVSAKDWESWCNEGTEYYLLFADNKPVARCAIERYSDTAWEAADVKTVPEYRNKGLSKEIVSVVTRKILEQGKIATCSTMPDNYAMLRVIEALGYDEINNNIVNFQYLNKSDFPAIANEIFNILADNMEIIAPTGNTREEDYKCWYEGVSNGLKRNERQIVLIKEADNIIGFFQYYTNADTFMMEEIQFKPEYQGRNTFRELYSFLIPNIREDIKFVEAYANITNHKSIGILEKLGLTKIGMNKNGRCFHFKGNYSDLVKWYNSKNKTEKPKPLG